MRLGIVGSRDFTDFDFMEQHIFQNFKVDYITAIVSGGAMGADILAERFADKYKIPTLIYEPKWATYGKKAGYMRNIDIVKNSDHLLAFWDGKSKGTSHSINLAKDILGPTKVTIVYFTK